MALQCYILFTTRIIWKYFLNTFCLISLFALLLWNNYNEKSD
jgi:hypothetical protein